MVNSQFLFKIFCTMLRYIIHVINFLHIPEHSCGKVGLPNPSLFECLVHCLSQYFLLILTRVVPRFLSFSFGTSSTSGIFWCPYILVVHPSFRHLCPLHTVRISTSLSFRLSILIWSSINFRSCLWWWVQVKWVTGIKSFEPKSYPVIPRYFDWNARGVRSTHRGT